MGAEAIQNLLNELDLESEIKFIEEEIPQTRSEAKIKKFTKRLKNC